MKKIVFILIVSASLFFYSNSLFAQCSICAKTVAQMGSKPAEGFNNGIIYLMLVPYVAFGVIGYKWWQNEKKKAKE